MPLVPQPDPEVTIATGSAEAVNRAVRGLNQAAERAGELTPEQQRLRIRCSVAIALRIEADPSFDAEKWDPVDSASLNVVMERGRFESEALREVLQHVAGVETWRAPFTSLSFSPSPMVVLGMIEDLLLQDGFVRGARGEAPVLSEHDEFVLASGVELFVESPEREVAEVAKRVLQVLGRQEDLA